MEATADTNPWPKAGIFSAIAACILVGGGLFVFSSIKPVSVEAPQAYSQFKSSDGTFACEYPQGWSTQNRNQQAIAVGGIFSKGAAEISATADLQGSLMGDVSRSAGNAIDIPPELARQAGLSQAVADLKKPPVEKVHAAEAKEAATKLDVKNYQEQDPKPFNTRLGDGRYSEFTGDADFPVGRVHGYRATILGTDRAIYVYCKCPEGDWSKLDKAFLRVIGSVGPAQ